jgi:hypothetical protein
MLNHLSKQSLKYKEDGRLILNRFSGCYVDGAGSEPFSVTSFSASGTELSVCTTIALGFNPYSLRMSGTSGKKNQ